MVYWWWCGTVVIAMIWPREEGKRSDTNTDPNIAKFSLFASLLQFAFCTSAVTRIHQTTPQPQLHFLASLSARLRRAAGAWEPESDFPFLLLSSSLAGWLDDWPLGWVTGLVALDNTIFDGHEQTDVK